MTTKYKDVNEFKRQVLAGEITNFEHRAWCYRLPFLLFSIENS